MLFALEGPGERRREDGRFRYGERQSRGGSCDYGDIRRRRGGGDEDSGIGWDQCCLCGGDGCAGVSADVEGRARKEAGGRR
jgi:hypothetical protein